MPPSIGLVSLTRDGHEVRIPDRDAAGLLWLRRIRAVEEQQDQISGQVYRVLEDGRPLWLRTELELTVSGKSREEDLGSILPAGWQLSAVKGPLPIAVDANGRLRAQVRAGTWRIQFDAFRTEDTRELAYAPGTTPAVAAEPIALRSRPEFRETEFEGVPPVDVNLTTFPEPWRSLPVFRWETATPLAATVVALGCIAGSVPPAAAQNFPPPELLDTLRGRLLETADAFPHAAEILTAALTIESGRVRLEAEVHAAVACGVPLPGRLPAWSPLTVTVDGEAATVCRRGDGYLWVWLEQGVHRVVVEGVLPDAAEWVWNAQLMPRRMTLAADEWNVRGLATDGRPDGPLFFTRREAAEAGEAVYDQWHYQSLVEVDRVLEIGLVWKVHTTVRRRSEPGQAITLRVPLLAGERVLTGPGDGPEGVIEVTLPADGNEFAWESELPITSEISLRSQAGPGWVERWSAVPSAVWNLQSEGIEPVYEEAAETLVPIWHPWPGDLDRPWVVTVSIWLYRLLMLLWGLWLANAVIRWIVEGWRQFTAGGAWRWRET